MSTEQQNDRTIWGKIAVITAFLAALTPFLHECSSTTPTVDYSKLTQQNLSPPSPQRITQNPQMASTCILLTGVTCPLGVAMVKGSVCSCYNIYGQVVGYGVTQ